MRMEIIIHRSESNWGSAKAIDGWHRRPPFNFKMIGYQYVICNSFITSSNWRLKQPDFISDGKIEIGRKVGAEGAHCRGHNRDSVGICLVGMRTFTSKQYASLVHLVKRVQEAYPGAEVFGHYELDKRSEKKNCPSIDMDYLRDLIENA